MLKSPSDEDYLRSRPPRTIIIAVDVPTLHILHTASLHLLDLPPHPPLAAVGQALRAELRIRHTRRWDRLHTLASAAGLAHDSDPVDFVYDVHANPDVWLVGGERRAQFAAREDEVATFALMLVPLVPGRHVLPRVEIRPRGGGRVQQQQRQHGKEGMTVSCETDYKSQAETVMVIANVKGTTVDMHVAGQAGSGAVLVGSEPRSGKVVS